MELSNRRMVELVQFSTCRLLEWLNAWWSWWNNFFESSNGGTVELAELVNLQMVKWWSWFNIVESSDRQIVGWWFG